MMKRYLKHVGPACLGRSVGKVFRMVPLTEFRLMSGKWGQRRAVMDYSTDGPGVAEEGTLGGQSLVARNDYGKRKRTAAPTAE